MANIPPAVEVARARLRHLTDERLAESISALEKTIATLKRREPSNQVEASLVSYAIELLAAQAVQRERAA